MRKRQIRVLVIGDQLDHPVNQDQITVSDALQASADTVARAEVVFVRDVRSAWMQAAWPRLEALRWVHVGAAGIDSVLFTELIESDVIVTNSRGVFDIAMAEYAIGLLLCFAKDFHRTREYQQARRWQPHESEVLYGKNLVIVGAGPIGHLIARYAVTFGMLVTGVARSGRTGAGSFDRIVEFTDIADALVDADYVIIVAPQTSLTVGMFDEALFSRMKTTAVVVNLGRGRIVDEASLIAALNAHQIAGVGLDVFTEEPLPQDNPLWNLPNVILSPHMAGDFVGWREAVLKLFLTNLRRWESGEPLLNVVDKHLGYMPTVRSSRAY